MNRELKLALIVGFSLVLLVTVLVSDHLSKARRADLAGVEATPTLASVDPTSQPAMSAEPPAGRSPGPDSAVVEQPAPAAPIAQEPGSGLGLAGAGTPTPASLTGVPTGPEAGAAPLVQFDQSGERSAGLDVDAGLTRVVRDLGGEIRQRDGMREIVLPTEGSRGPEESVPASAGASDEVRHVVAAGESLFTIARKYYGDGTRWRRIQEANPDRVSASGVVRAGVTLKIPGATATGGAAGSASPTSEPSKPRIGEPRTPTRRGEGLASKGATGRPGTYTVRRGDTLGEIAQRMLGSAKRKGELMRLNNISDENTILAGAVLRLPER